MNVTKLVFSGSVDEFEKVAHLFVDVANVNVAAVGIAEVPVESTGTETIKEKVRRVLKQRPLTALQRGLLNRLYQANGDFVTQTELMDALQLSANQLSGVLGSLGTRVATAGVAGLGFSFPLQLLIDFKTAENDWMYRLQDDVRLVLEEEHLL